MLVFWLVIQMVRFQDEMTGNREVMLYPRSDREGLFADVYEVNPDTNARTRQRYKNSPLTNRSFPLSEMAPLWTTGGKCLNYSLFSCSSILQILTLTSSQWCSACRGRKRSPFRLAHSSQHHRLWGLTMAGAITRCQLPTCVIQSKVFFL